MREMPAGESIAAACARVGGATGADEVAQRWGAAVAWEELHAWEWRREGVMAWGARFAR